MSFQDLSDGVLSVILRYQSAHQRVVVIKKASKKLFRCCNLPSVWGTRADIRELTQPSVCSLASSGALRDCFELICAGTLVPLIELLEKGDVQLPLKKIEMENTHGAATEIFSMAKASLLPTLTEFIMGQAAAPWPNLDTNLELSSLRVLHVIDSLDMAFVDTATFWTSDSYRFLEELCWTTSSRLPEPERRAAAHDFLSRLGKAMGPDFGTRRRAFRVNVCNARPPAPGLRLQCGLCCAKLFTCERIYAIGPGTQPHIDMEAFVLGESICPDLTLLDGISTQLNCCQRCHERLGLFLIARRGSFIDTCGFEYAGACGKQLVNVVFIQSSNDESASLAPIDLDVFLRCEGSFRASHRRVFSDIGML